MDEAAAQDGKLSGEMKDESIHGKSWEPSPSVQGLQDGMGIEAAWRRGTRSKMMGLKKVADNKKGSHPDLGRRSGRGGHTCAGQEGAADAGELCGHRHPGAYVDVSSQWGGQDGDGW